MFRLLPGKIFFEQVNLIVLENTVGSLLGHLLGGLSITIGGISGHLLVVPGDVSGFSGINIARPTTLGVRHTA
jgi:hypothetical protein